MKLHCRISVYRGGIFWKECWKSVLENIDIFDGIYISVNKSDLQEEDIAIIREVKSDKIHWICQDRFLTAVEHGKRLDNWIKNFHLEGHIYMLCHDDILERKGLLELHSLKIRETDAVFCRASFCFQGKRQLPFLAGEVNGLPCVMPLERFLLIHDSVALNVSRLVLPAALFNSGKVVPQMLKYGYWAELCYLCNPFTESICTTSEPTVKIRMHDNSEGAVSYPSKLLFDSIVQRLQIFHRFNSGELAVKMAADCFYLIRKNFFPGTIYFFQAQMQLMKIGYFSPLSGIKMVACFIQIAVKRCVKVISSGFEHRKNPGE